MNYTSLTSFKVGSCSVQILLVFEALLDVGGDLRMPRLLCQLEDPLALAQEVSLWTRALAEVGSVADEQLHTFQMTVLGCYHEGSLPARSVCPNKLSLNF